MKCPFKPLKFYQGIDLSQYAPCMRKYNKLDETEYHFCDDRTEEEKTDLTQKLIDQYKPVLEKLAEEL